MIEIMIVIVIVGVMITTATITMNKASNYYRLRSCSIDLSQTIQYVRQYALEKNKMFGIKFDADSIIVFQYDPPDTIVESVYHLPSNISFGVNDNVNSGVGYITPPPSGIAFNNEKILAFPHKGVTKGVLYFKSPKESRALAVNSLGYPTLYIWGGDTWDEQ
ncbi:hypothetical protein JXI42_14455 [bacterium]|nr:hypothetical protein [bacterium]